MTTTPRRSFTACARLLLLLPALALCGCEAVPNLIYEPEVTDPLDGYQGSLAQAGINTEMDWGPKQNLLLSRYKTLLEEHTNLKRQHEELLAENQNLQSQLNGESSALQKQRVLREQAEAETEMLRQRRRDLEARILSLSIENAKLEQSNLLSKIGELEASLQQPVNDPAEASAQPPR